MRSRSHFCLWPSTPRRRPVSCHPLPTSVTATGTADDDDDTACTVPHDAADADGSALSDGTEKNINNNNNNKRLCDVRVITCPPRRTDGYDHDYDRRRPGPFYWCSVRKRPPPQIVVSAAPDRRSPRENTHVCVHEIRENNNNKKTRDPGIFRRLPHTVYRITDADDFRPCGRPPAVDRGATELYRPS
ncbi:hypothetical protein QTP88_002081 [Uroleucon formosanum]